MSETEDLKAKLKEMIVERLFLKVNPEEIADDDSLMQSYGVDSVQLFEVVVGLEEDFGITLEDEDFSLEQFANVNSIAALVESKRAALGT